MKFRTCTHCRQTEENKPFPKHGYLCKECKSVQLKKAYKDRWFTFTCRLKRAYCKKNGLAFNLTPEYLESIYTDSCPIFGVKFIRGNKSLDQSPTLDRLDPKLGYVQGNVTYISARANRIKYDATVEELGQVIKWIESATTISTLK